MAKVGRYNVGFNKGANAGAVLMNLVMLIIWLSVGDTIINALKNGIMNQSTVGTFYQTYNFLGLIGSTSTGIISVIGILLGVGVLIQVFRVTRT